MQRVDLSDQTEDVEDSVEHFTVGHFAFYNHVGRTEVRPISTDPEATGAHIHNRFGAFPFLEPAEIRGFGLVRERNVRGVGR